MSEIDTPRAGAGAVIAERSVRYAPRRTGRSPVGIRPVRAPGSQTALRFVAGGALILALAAAVFAAEGLTQASRSQTKIAALQGELAGLRQRVRADERVTAGAAAHVRTLAARTSGTQRALNHVNWELTSVPTESEVAHLRGELAVYTACIPELKREVDRLAITWRINPTKPSADYVKTFTAAPLSASCAAALAGR